MTKKKPLSPAERKRKERERDKALGLAELRLKMSTTERGWIETGARVRGYEDQTEYVIDLARHDLTAAGIVTDHRAKNDAEVLAGGKCAHDWHNLNPFGELPRHSWCRVCGTLKTNTIDPTPASIEVRPTGFDFIPLSKKGGE